LTGTKIVASYGRVVLPTLRRPGWRQGADVLEFFAVRVKNLNTRRACGLAVADFRAWCDHNWVPLIAAVWPMHVVAWIEKGGRSVAL